MTVRFGLWAKLIAPWALAAMLGGCVAGPAPRNYSGAAWMPEQEGPRNPAPQCLGQPSAPPENFLSGQEIPARMLRDAPVLLAPGDRLRIAVVGDSDDISGVYVIGKGGVLDLPGLAPVAARALTVRALEARLREALLRARLVQPLARVVEVRLIESGGVSVSVSGAVFQPGTVRAGERASEDRVGQREGMASGDDNPGRTLSTALRAAGGIRPDADIHRIYLVRGGQWARIDLGNTLTGAGLAEVQLTVGDRIFVASTGCFNEKLVRPSAVTAPGIRVFMSNLSRSAASNASAAIGKETTSLPYGTRFLQGLVSANCVGGSAMNAHRRAVLISRNPVNGRSIVVERKVEELVRGADRDAWDPFLMPGDAIACYDSRAMNFRDAVTTLGDAIGAATPALLLEKGL
ncbi:polysaccharide biosynthesis/export family protein [Novosphingobium beihaiensis]|uniref:Polysaccharide biosynthesis/export family protein n=1 Tax=Novosphingobium beihaiensis TaxID=2930389 RepID=A0ABT0BUZ4_9SPHN|nr:polysaccharide biosynthesis/export family protein [Novosphingobium beihaiensis]MCJ2188852.1 polysaccharide biosynthesis/export family protein [Novosphingobium beihaiensis]